MKKNIVRLLMMVGLLTLAPAVCFAQSANEYFNTGLAQMKKKDYQGAIASFTASKSINKSAAHVKKCNAQIAKCNRLMKSGGGDAPKPVTKNLTLTTYHLYFGPDDEETKIVGIKTEPESNDWTATVAPEGEEWCRLTKSIDGKDMHVTCIASNKTIPRLTGINVIYGETSKFIQIMQHGRKPQLYADNAILRLKKNKGITQQLAITCNSDTTYADGKNWQLVKAPEWCNAEVTGNNELTIRVDKLNKTDREYKTGRTGDIVLRSQEEEFIIRVDQN